MFTVSLNNVKNKRFKKFILIYKTDFSSFPVKYEALPLQCII